MSVVTNIILTFPLPEPEDNVALKKIKDYLRAQYGSVITCVSGHAAGGNKVMECSVYVGAYNHFDHIMFADVVKSAGWLDLGAVQLFVKRQEEPTFTEVLRGA